MTIFTRSSFEGKKRAGGADFTGFLTGAMILCALFICAAALAQTCPPSSTGIKSISVSPNTYYPGTTAVVTGGTTTTIALGAVPSGYGTTPIAIGDQLLIIQMQGANLTSTANANTYGDGVTGSGYTTGATVRAGKMEVITATNAVAITGGNLTVATAPTLSYATQAYTGTTGQRMYQVIQLGTASSFKIATTITVPKWNGTVGGIMFINAVQQIDLNGQLISGVGSGFKGGGGRQLTGGTLFSTNTDYRFTATGAVHGSKGEGIAGMPQYTNPGGTATAPTNNTVEGYQNGSMARGAPGTAGGGGTDNDVTTNGDNSGGGGGGNGGPGGLGGNAWSTGATVGGLGGSKFAQTTSALFVMGGGGGAGSNNNGSDGLAGFGSSGVAGGGIVILNANTIVGAGTVDVSGAIASSVVQNDGSGGGGAGGSILVLATSGWSGVTAVANGGDGGSNTPGAAVSPHGPGGGGGGGVIYSNGTLDPTSTVTGGAAGFSINTSSGTVHFGALGGSAGVITQNVALTAGPVNIRACQTVGLPVTLQYFAVNNAGDKDLVTWATSSEVNFKQFELERSTDGTSFSQLAVVPGATNSSDKNTYAYTDAFVTPPAPILYYRLKMVDIDQRFQYSQVVAIHLDQRNREKLSVYPNPTTGSVQVDMISDGAGTANLKIFDNSGRQYFSTAVPVKSGENVVQLSQVSNLMNGFYIVQVILNGKIYNHKLIKQ